MIVGLFWLVIFAFGANWFALSPLLVSFTQTYQIVSWQAHLLLSLIGMFVIFFAWPAGTFIDKKGPKLCTSIGVIFMILGFGLRPWLLDNFYTMLLSSILAGIGLAWILVAMAPQMIRWFPHTQASLPIGIAASGLFIGFGTGSLLTPFIVEGYSMYLCFLIFALLAVIAGILWIVLARDSPPTPPEKRPEIQKMKFGEALKRVTSTKNSFLFPIIGFITVGITLVISTFIHYLYRTQAEQGGYIAGFLLYGCAIGAFIAPYTTKKYGVKKIALIVATGSILTWVLVFGVYTLSMSWLLVVLVALLFGIFLQASWPLALYSQETEPGVSESNIGVAASLYISMSNIGAAVLPEIYGIVKDKIEPMTSFTVILIALVLCLVLWVFVKRK